MRYTLKQQFSIDSEFAIKNERGEELGKVIGRVRTKNTDEHLKFLDTNGNEYARITRALPPVGYNNEIGGWNISRNGEQVIWMRGEPGATNFRLDGSPKYELVGSGYDYTLHRGGKLAATVSREVGFLSLLIPTDTYQVDVVDGEDVVMVLSVAVAIDLDHEQK